MAVLSELETGWLSTLSTDGVLQSLSTVTEEDAITLVTVTKSIIMLVAPLVVVASWLMT